MTEYKKELHELIDAITSKNTAEYLVTFIALFLEKWGGADKIPCTGGGKDV